MDLGLADKAFIVTGGSTGLGLAGAAALAADGAHVVLSARDRERVHAAAATVGGLGVVADLGDPEAAPRLVRAAHDAYGRVDGALISVGGPPGGATLDMTDEQWRTSFDSIFLGALRMVREVVAALPPEGGALALVLSSSVKSPIPGLAISNGLRPGLGMLVKTLADELGPRAVRINALLPGRFDTDRIRELDGGDSAARARGEAAVPLGRYGLPQEFGRVAAFLLSPAASYVSGSMIAVDGGLTRAL